MLPEAIPSAVPREVPVTVLSTQEMSFEVARNEKERYPATSLRLA